MSGPREIPRHAWRSSYHPQSSLPYEEQQKCGVPGCGLPYEAEVHWVAVPWYVKRRVVDVTGRVVPPPEPQRGRTIFTSTGQGALVPPYFIDELGQESVAPPPRLEVWLAKHSNTSWVRRGSLLWALDRLALTLGAVAILATGVVLTVGFFDPSFNPDRSVFLIGALACAFFGYHVITYHVLGRG